MGDRSADGCFISPNRQRGILFVCGWVGGGPKEESTDVLFPRIPNVPVGIGPRYVAVKRNAIRWLIFTLEF